MKQLFFLFFVLCSLAVAGGEPKQAELKVDLYEWGSDTVLVWVTAPQDRWVDTLVAKDGRITYRVATQEQLTLQVLPQKSQVMLPKGRGTYMPRAKAIEVVLFPGSKQQVTGWFDAPGLLVYTAKGSDRYYTDAAALRNKLLPHLAQEDRLYVAQVNAANKATAQSLYEQRRALAQTVDSIQLDFLVARPTSQLSGVLLGSARRSDRFFEYEKQLSPKVRNGMFKDQIDLWASQERAHQAVKIAKDSIVVGAQAPPIELVDSSGVVRTLAELKGQWVVVDFWGTWCGWCIKGIPAMKATYEQHQPKLALLGVACNDKPDQWRAALVKYGLPWINVFEADKGAESSPVRYGVEGYPTKFLVDPQGKIALKVVGEDPQFYTQIEQLIKEQ